MDEDLRTVGLREHRRRNFQQLLESLTRHVPGGSLLDVGSAHGWFLEIAAARYTVTGIEPEGSAAGLTDRGWPVIRGYFPRDVDSSLRFDVITFHDALEHIPNLRGTLETCHARLNNKGVLLLNLPNRTGAIYRTSKLLLRLGVQSPFARMWQKDLPSPHLHYLGSAHLRRLLDGCGFDVIETGDVPAVSIDGLRERIAFTGAMGAVGRWLVFVGVLASIPFLRILPSDTVFVIARRRTP